MKRLEESSSRPRLVSVDPKKITVPKVRVTSTWSSELLEMFKKSIEAMGIQQPLVCVKHGEKLLLVDGLHRLEEAKLQNKQRVPAVLIPGDMKDVLLKNLMMNRLRGGTKASEMIKVITELRNKHEMTSEDIAKETGLRRDYIEKMLQTSRAIAEVQEALDREEIGVGHAYEISRVPNRDVQLRLLNQVFTFRLTVKDLHNVVNETLEILKRREQLEKKPRAPEPTSIPTVRCHLCGNEWPLNKVVGINVDMGCYAIAYDAVQKAIREGRIPKPQQYAQEATETPRHETLSKEQTKKQQSFMAEVSEVGDVEGGVSLENLGEGSESSEVGSEEKPSSNPGENQESSKFEPGRIQNLGKPKTLKKREIS